MPEEQETELKTPEKAEADTAEANAEPMLDESEAEQSALVARQEAAVDQETMTGESKPVKIRKARKIGHYHLHDTVRAESLEGRPLATFRQRFIAFAIDFLLVCIVGSAVATLVPILLANYLHVQPVPVETASGAHNLHFGGANLQVTLPEDRRTERIVELTQVIVILLYFGLSNWLTNGLTLGKRIMGIRVASLTHERITLWQSCERALGYGASALECFFGFFQYFIYPNRTCVHDRIAETIVVMEPRVKKEKGHVKK